MDRDQELWSEAAEQYHQFVGSPQDKLRTELLYPAIFNLLGDISNKKLLDIGCGNGFFAYEAAKKGASVKAFDSKAMIEIAQKHFSHPNIAFQTHDASKVFPYAADQFDYITANMVLMDMEKIDMLLQESNRVLKANGKAVFSILHPCFTPPVGRFRRGLRGRMNKKHAYFHLHNYFSPPQTQKDLFGQKTNYYHHIISDYAHSFQHHGFVIANIQEPQPDQSFMSRYPHFFHAEHIAIFLIFVLQKNRH